MFCRETNECSLVRVNTFNHLIGLHENRYESHAIRGQSAVAHSKYQHQIYLLTAMRNYVVTAAVAPLGVGLWNLV
jgi:hypothetical protein